jgi:hypothetical protein
MNRREFLVGAVAALGASNVLAADAPASSEPDVQALVGDVRIVRAALALHPGLHRYNRPADIDARLKKLERSFSTARGLEGRYLELSRFLATIRCGHTYGNFFNQKDAVARTLFDRGTRLPFHFRWLGGRMVVVGGGPAVEGLPVGGEVVAVNGVPASKLLASLLPYARADGHNEAKRVSLLEVRGDDSIEYFDVFHGLVHGVPANGVHRLDVRRPDGKRATLEVPALTLEQRRAARPVEPAEGSPLWQWEERPDGVVLLTMPSWALYESKWDWRTWLDERLSSLKGARGLVVDLRGNEGGQDCGDVLLARLATRDLQPPGYEQRLRFERTPPELDKHLTTWDNSFRTLGVGAKPLPGGFYARPGGEEILRITPKGPRLECKVAALVGPVNSSATFQFAQVAQASGLVRLFGSTTGGNRRGINGGCFFFVRLPASGLEFDLPLVGYFATTPQPDAGLEPDAQVALTAADLANGRDPVRDRAIAWVAKG